MRGLRRERERGEETTETGLKKGGGKVQQATRHTDEQARR